MIDWGGTIQSFRFEKYFKLSNLKIRNFQQYSACNCFLNCSTIYKKDLLELELNNLLGLNFIGIIYRIF